jgi:N-acetylmuramic acid 6-phosphate (MurNAc-6-P) etherase
MTVNVSGTTGPFVITSQNTDNLSWFQGQSTINWSVNNTNTLPGSANVNIRLSVDGELLFLCYWQVIPQMMALRQL